MVAMKRVSRTSSQWSGTSRSVPVVADRYCRRDKVIKVSDPISRLPDWQLARLAILLDALNGVPVSYPETASLAWLAGQELVTVENIAAVIRRVRSTGNDRPCSDPEV
jgi:hypothetical protein